MTWNILVIHVFIFSQNALNISQENSLMETINVLNCPKSKSQWISTGSILISILIYRVHNYAESQISAMPVNSHACSSSFDKAMLAFLSKWSMSWKYPLHLMYAFMIKICIFTNAVRYSSYSEICCEEKSHIITLTLHGRHSVSNHWPLN